MAKMTYKLQYCSPFIFIALFLLDFLWAFFIFCILALALPSLGLVSKVSTWLVAHPPPNALAPNASRRGHRRRCKPRKQQYPVHTFVQYYKA